MNKGVVLVRGLVKYVQGELSVSLFADSSATPESYDALALDESPTGEYTPTPDLCRRMAEQAAEYADLQEYRSLHVHREPVHVDACERIARVARLEERLWLRVARLLEEQ